MSTLIQSVFVIEKIPYRAIPGFEGYVAREDGTIWTCRKRVPLKGGGSAVELTEEWRECRQFSKKNPGYMFVYLGCDGMQHHKTVHSLMLLAFSGDRPKGQQCRHLDGDRFNNSISNLKYGTALENSVDKKNHLIGTGAGNTSVDFDDVSIMRKMARAGCLLYDIADYFGATYDVVQDAVSGNTFRDFVDEPPVSVGRDPWKRRKNKGLSIHDYLKSASNGTNLRN